MAISGSWIQCYAKMGTKLLKFGSGSYRSLMVSIFLILYFSFPKHVAADIVVHDFREKTIKLKRPAERVVCLIESALTGIYMLRKQEKLVGIPTNVYDEGYYYSETFKYYSLLDERIRLRKIPAVGNWESVNLEKIISIKPDLVIIWANQTDVIETLERIGIPVYAVFITKIEDIFKEISDFGVMLGAKSQAEKLINFVKREITDIEKIALKIRSPKKLFYSWAQLNFLQTSCKGSIVDEIILKIGAKNICGDIEGESKVLTMEKLILHNPDVIVMWHSKFLKPEDIRKNKQYRTITAVRRNSIYQFDETFIFDLWTLKFLYAMKFMAKAAYPEIYTFELEEEKRKIINFLYGKKLIN